MECGHTFCNDCWKQHFTVQITEGNSKRLLCMAVKCGAICDDRKVYPKQERHLAAFAILVTRVSSLLDWHERHSAAQVVKLLQHNRQLVDKYQIKLLESYIEDNKRVKWCPSVPHCGCAIQVRPCILHRPHTLAMSMDPALAAVARTVQSSSCCHMCSSASHSMTAVCR